MPGDNINWFGVKVGAGDESSGNSSGVGIGKYLVNGKRPLELEGTNKDFQAENSKKKKRLGFGDFEAW